ncbi:MAG TPA: hypothetical protein VNO70_17480 [Blastocatellia bacterium]|nr:hypothetical protein [Blastocatellia bacterium]
MAQNIFPAQRGRVAQKIWLTSTARFLSPEQQIPNRLRETHMGGRRFAMFCNVFGYFFAGFVGLITIAPFPLDPGHEYSAAPASVCPQQALATRYSARAVYNWWQMGTTFALPASLQEPGFALRHKGYFRFEIGNFKTFTQSRKGRKEPPHHKERIQTPSAI